MFFDPIFTIFYQYNILPRNVEQEKVEVFGEPIQIVLCSNTVRVHFETTASSEAIQWLDAEQTLGKKHPFLFTQCQGS